MPIELGNLKSSDVGRTVLYSPPHRGKVPQIGTLSSWNNRYIFVRYTQGDTAAATDPKYLDFLGPHLFPRRSLTPLKTEHGYPEGAVRTNPMTDAVEVFTEGRWQPMPTPDFKVQLVDLNRETKVKRGPKNKLTFR